LDDPLLFSLDQSLLPSSAAQPAEPSSAKKLILVVTMIPMLCTSCRRTITREFEIIGA
jgi:hypothetical protein